MSEAETRGNEPCRQSDLRRSATGHPALPALLLHVLQGQLYPYIASFGLPTALDIPSCP
jgi:hypothetical protein